MMTPPGSAYREEKEHNGCNPFLSPFWGPESPIPVDMEVGTPHARRGWSQTSASQHSDTYKDLLLICNNWTIPLEAYWMKYVLNRLVDSRCRVQPISPDSGCPTPSIFSWFRHTSHNEMGSCSKKSLHKNTSVCFCISGWGGFGGMWLYYSGFKQKLKKIFTTFTFLL